MDTRPPPPSFSRPQERPLIHNPNHAGQPPPQPHTPFFQPPTSQQPPIQIPFSDPFQPRRADPFMPNTQTQRRGSYGIQSGRDGGSAPHSERPQTGNMWQNTSGPSASNTPSHLAHSAPPPPPPPPATSSVHSGSNPPSYAYDPTRRRLSGGHSPPRYYGSAPQQEPPSSTSFAGRQMPPPSPSQQQPHAAGYGAQRPPFSSGRDLPGLGLGHRPGSGMSISSILGTDSPSQPQSSRPQHSPPTAQSPNAPSMRPPSPRRGQSAGSRTEMNQQWRRPQTPEKTSAPSALRMAENTAYSAGSSPRYFGQPPRGSPEYQRNGPPPQHSHYHSHPTPPRSSQHAYHNSSPGNIQDNRVTTEERPPPRPTSQPAAYAMASREQDPREVSGPGPIQPPYGGAVLERNLSQEERRSHSGAVYGDRPNTSVSSAERAVTVQPLSQSGYSPPGDQRHDVIMHRNQGGRDQVREEPNRDYVPSRRDESSGPFRTGFRGQYYNQPPTSAPPGEAPRSHPQPLDHFRRAPEVQQFGGQDTAHGFGRLPPQPVADHQGPERRRDDMAFISDPRNPTYDSQPRRQGGEEMQQSRSLLGINDPNRRGRASPLPQAVQGAQAQLVGPGTDPNIKSEFGRIFQGLGSGLGGPGTLTPSRQSPVPQRMRDDVAPISASENDGLRMTRVVSGGRGRGRRVKNEDSRPEADDGRATPSTGGGRGRRGKTVHHHHIHPTRGAHHHHINPRSSEDSPSLQPTKNGTGSQNASGAHHHHHHIHVPSHAHHHHHHPPRQAIPPVAIPKPTLKLTLQPFLDGVKHKPRYHLGNGLYRVEISPPPLATADLQDKFPFYMQYKAPRRFTAKDENCTYTIRVPRKFLSEENREKFCAFKYLFGTEIFTDDSCPISAAIHSGWIRGYWGSDIDENLMDLPPPAPEDEPVPDNVTQVPKAPIVPPPKKDAQITILVLPRLEKYASTLRFGVRSRPWGNNHDGVSFMILGIKFVDHSPSSEVEWTGEGRRKRMLADFESRDLFRGAMVPAKRLETSALVEASAA